uniref:Phytocyanin domain-containing protein n=1 Tax=Kalanchoe fedtschenkoi TaxID=63787 RepID=A0A7N0TMI8_KALFE
MGRVSLMFCAVLGLVCLGGSYTRAKTYTVGDSSGWDISSDLDLWTVEKKFQVGDVLVFQYSNTHSVSEVSKDSFDGCSTTDTIKTYKSDGNTTVELAKPGDMYFVCGNRLHCLGGMKLQVHVDGSEAYAPAGAPQASTGESDLPGGTGKPASGAARGSSHVLHLTLLGAASLILLVQI